MQTDVHQFGSTVKPGPHDLLFGRACSPARPFLAGLTATMVAITVASADDWPAWRGPTDTGVSREADLPVTWGPSANVKWKIALPGPGSSTPIVWKQSVILTQAKEGGKQRSTICLNRIDGSLRWESGLEYSEREPTHGDNTYCSASPVTDGERIIVSYGSAGMLCYDFEGKEQWRYEVGKLHHIWGNASSPVLYGDLCFMNCGPGDRTFLLALDKRTGTKRWQVDVEGMSGGDGKSWIGSWSTPLVAKIGGKDQLLMSFPNRLTAYDPKTGEVLWWCDGLGRLVYTTPLVANDVAIAMSGYHGPALGLRLGGSGDITKDRIWHRPQQQPQRIGSGVILGDKLYILNEPGVMECIELETGKTLWQQRLSRASWSSLLYADGKFYVPDRFGDCFVFRVEPEFEVLAKNSLGEHTQASIVASNGELFIRTYKSLWCIASTKSGETAPSR